MSPREHKASAGPPHAPATAPAVGSAWAHGIRTYYEIRGAGPWLVLSHSLACDHTMWEAQIEVLARSFRVLAYDTRGHGRSSAPVGPYSLAMLADDLKALLDALSIERCHFVGLSMGGMIGQTFALAYPGVFHSLVLCDTSCAFAAGAEVAWEERVRTASEQGMTALVAPTLQRWLTEETHRTQPQALALLGRQIAATPLEGYAACSRALVDIDTTARLHELALPTLVIVGALDVGTPPAMARVIQQEIVGAELVVIDSAAHFPNIEQPGPFNAALLAFLDRQVGAGPATETT